MTIKVKDRTAAIYFELPVFIGTTGDSSEGIFPDVGWHEPIAAFAPVKGENGTLVFDRPTYARSPISATLYHYWWKDNKLVVKEGFDASRFLDRVRLDSTLGLTWGESGIGTYHTSPSPSSSRGKLVGIIDLLRFLEGKISLQALNDKVVG